MPKAGNGPLLSCRERAGAAQPRKHHIDGGKLRILRVLAGRVDGEFAGTRGCGQGSLLRR